MLNVIHCPACGLKLQIPEDLLRKRVMCPTCNQTFDADSWVLEPEEIPTSVPGSPLRQTEAPVHQQAGHQAGYKEGALQQGAFHSPFDHPAGGATAVQTPPPGTGPAPYGPPPPWRSPASAADTKPGRVEAIGIMLLVGGIIALSYSGATPKFHIIRLWGPFAAYSLVLGIMAIIRGIRILRKGGPCQRSPRTIAIMQVINIVNFDVVNFVLGLVTLSFLKDPAVRRYFRE